ncbi:MAG TPA: type II secretion system F family protein [Gemmatimonadaceae bacterium]|nr:type II secretion system F family protein [Gemmatimonadaceae bacterium]
MTARYRYRAADASGRVIEGDLQSQSRRSAIEDLRRQSLFPVDVSEIGAIEQSHKAERSSLADALAVWTRTLATMLSAGLPLERALSFASGESSNATLTTAVESVRTDIRDGSSFARALRKQPKVFGALYVAMASAGEESGALDQVLARLADNLDEAAELRGKVRSALLYPALMAIVATMGVTVILLFVIPRFVEMLGEVGGALPFSTRLLIALSSAMTGWWWVWVPLAAAAVALVYRWHSAPANRYKWHRARLGIPVFGDLERNYVTARFARTVGLLQRSGVGIMSSLRIARSAITNDFIGEQVERVTEGVEQGRRLGTELQGIFPPLAVQLMSVGEESGRLAELCLRVADNYDRDVSRRLRTAISLLEPTLIVVFGLLVGFVALAMLQAIYSVNAHVG